jgi:hypothetical protein
MQISLELPPETSPAPAGGLLAKRAFLLSKIEIPAGILVAFSEQSSGHIHDHRLF